MMQTLVSLEKEDDHISNECKLDSLSPQQIEPGISNLNYPLNRRVDTVD